MITQETEYYIRFILLLLEAGTDLLREILEKALQQKGETLNQFLNSTEPLLRKDRCLTQIQIDTLYPISPKISSSKDFDITILSHLVLKYLKLYIDNNEKQGVKDIRDLRNNYHAHAAEGKMNEATFRGEWKQFATIIRYTGNGLSPDVQKRHRDMIASIEKDHLDITAVAEQITKLDQSIVFFQNIQSCLDDINKVQKELVGAVENVKTIAQNTDLAVEHVRIIAKKSEVEIVSTHKDVLDTKQEVLQIKAMLVQITEQRENQGRPTKVANTVFGKITLSAEDQDTVDKAEAILLEASNNSIAKKEPTNASHKILQEKVTLAIEDIEKKDVKVEGAKKGSIIFEFKCMSLTAILELIDYYYSPSFQRRIDEVAQALEDIIGKKICITSGGIDRQSLQDVIIKMDKKEYEKVVQFELSCSGVEGLTHAIEVFEEGKAVNSINELSHALSDAVGKPVTLHTSIDINQMRKAINLMPKEQANKSQDSYTKGNEPPIDSEIMSHDTQSGLKQPRAKQVIADLKSEDELMKHPRSFSYPQRRYRKHSKADKKAESSRSSECKLWPASIQDDPKAEPDDVFTKRMMGFHLSSINLPYQSSPSYPYFLASSSWPGSVKQGTSKSEHWTPSCTQAFDSQDSHTKGNDPLIKPVITSYDIQSGLKQQSAKQDIADLESIDEIFEESVDELIKHSMSSRQPSYRKFSFEADKEVEPSRTYKRLRHSMQGDSHSHPPSPDSSSDWLKGIEQITSETGYKKPSYTQDLELSVNENYQDEIKKPDPLHSVHPSVRDTNSGDSKEHLEISGMPFEGLMRKNRFKLKEQARHLRELRLRRFIEEASTSSSHQLDRFSLVYQEEIPVLCDIDDTNSTIYSCAILSNERLMIADGRGLHIVNIHTGRVEQKKTLDTMYSDIAVLPNDQVAVTLPFSDEVVILSTNDLTEIRNILNINRPLGVTYHNDKLYVVCAPDYERLWVNILHLQCGSIRQIIKCDKQLFRPYAKIALSMHAENLYISGNNSLIKYSANGGVIARYSFTESELKVLTLLNDGSLVVVSETIHGIHTIHHISADLQQGYELKIDQRNIRCLGVDPVNNQVYAICKDTIKVYYMQKQPIQCQSEMKLTAGIANEKLSSLQALKAKKRFSSPEADKVLTSLKAGQKLLPFETDEKLASIKTEMKLPSLKTEEKLTLFKAGKRIRRKVDFNSVSFQAVPFGLSESDENPASFKARTRLHSRETDKELK